MADTSHTSPLEYIREYVISGEAAGGETVKKLAPVRVNPVLTHPHERRVKLSGQWGFRLDPEDAGVEQRWFENMHVFGEQIAVPGCWQGQGFGTAGEDEVADFRLRARVFQASYQGTGWYAKNIQPPAEWKGSRIWLVFGGVHPSAEVWLNGARIGSNGYPFLPFGFEITGIARFDQENNLVVRVHEQNRMLGFTYNFQGNWSGIYRDVELVATGGKLHRAAPHLSRGGPAKDALHGGCRGCAKERRQAVAGGVCSLVGGAPAGKQHES